MHSELDELKLTTQRQSRVLLFVIMYFFYKKKVFVRLLFFSSEVSVEIT